VKYILVLSILFSFGISPTPAIAEKEDCVESLKNLMSSDIHVPAMQNLLKLKGKLTLHRLAWATTNNEEGTKSFKIENKIDSILDEIKTNKDPAFIAAKETYKKNKLSRTALARIMPFIKDILNKQNSIKDPLKRNLYIIQESDLKLLAILAENEEKKSNGVFNDILYRDRNSQKSVLNYTKVINSSMRQREVSSETKSAITKQLKSLTKKISQVIASLPLSEPCKGLLINECFEKTKETQDNNLFSLIKDFENFNKQEHLKYDDFWLHVGKKKKYIKPAEKFEEPDFVIPAELTSSKLNEHDYFNKLASFVLDKYPYFVPREKLVSTPELLLSLVDAIDNKHDTFTYNGKEYFLPNNYNPSEYSKKGADLLANTRTIAITPMDRKLNLPHVKMIDKQRADFSRLKKLIPRNSLTDKQQKEFHHLLIAANYYIPTQRSFDYLGSIYDSKTGEILPKTIEGLLSYPTGINKKNSLFKKYKNLPKDQKEILFASSLSSDRTYIYKDQLHSISNKKVDIKKILNKNPILYNKIKNDEEAKKIDSMRDIAQAIIEKKKTVQIGVNVVSPLTLDVYSYKDQEKIFLDFQTNNKIKPTNPVSLNSQTRKDWFQAVMNNHSTFKSDGVLLNTLDAQKSHASISTTKEKMLDYNKYKALEEKLNSLDDKNLIIEFHKNFVSESQCEHYTIIDKKRQKISVYNKQGEEKFSKEILLGEIKSDKRTQFLKTTDPGRKKYTNKTTAAGIFYAHDFRDEYNDKYYKTYNNNLLALVTEKGAFNGPLNKAGEYETVLALHQVPINMEYRNPLFSNNRNDDNRATNGCINFLQKDFEEYKSKFPATGCPVYILPEEKGNRMKIKDSKIVFTPKDTSLCNKQGVCNTDYYYSPDNAQESKDISIVIMNSARANNPLVRRFTSTLENKKSELSSKLKLSNDEFNDLSHLAYAIFGVESDFGAGKRYKLKEGRTFASSDTNSPSKSSSFLNLLRITIGSTLLSNSNQQQAGQALVSTLKYIDGNDSKNSRGLTQIKRIISYTKELYPHITEDNLAEPENAAIATVVVLNEMKKELKSLSKKHNNISPNNKLEFLYYVYNGAGSQIKNGNATPQINIKTQRLKTYLDEIKVYQKM
jgi:hypothetical protein